MAPLNKHAHIITFLFSKCMTTKRQANNSFSYFLPFTQKMLLINSPMHLIRTSYSQSESNDEFTSPKGHITMSKEYPIMLVSTHK